MTGRDNALLNLAQLKAFALIVETGSASQAAAILFRAQSAVARSIQEIEHFLQESLFERRASGMLPTPAARAVFERGQRILSDLEKLARWCDSLREPPASTRSPRLASNTTIPAYLLNSRRLQILATLVKHRHMVSTAAALGVSQPAVSSAIRILEEGAGFALFARMPGGLKLTERGEVFALRVRQVLNELGHIPDDIAALKGIIRGRVSIGALPLARPRILPEAVAKLRHAAPGIRIATDDSPYEMLVAGLRAGDIYFILGALRKHAPGSGLATEKLMSERMGILVRDGHPLTKLGHTGQLSLAQLMDSEWILPRSNAPARALLDTLFERMHLSAPLPAVETADLALIRGLLLRTDMVAALSAQQLQYECDLGALTMLNVDLPNTERDIGFMFREDSQPSAAAQCVIEIIRKVVTDFNQEIRLRSEVRINP